MNLPHSAARTTPDVHAFLSHFTLAATAGFAAAFLASAVVPSASARIASAAPATDSKSWELTKKTVPELVKMMKIGTCAQKSQAAQAIGDKAFAGDTTAKEAIPALLQALRCMTGGKVAEDAAVALAKIGLPAAERLKDELTGVTKQSNNSSKLLAVRALGLMGPEVKDMAGPTLIAILENPKRNLKARDPFVNEAALALANMGGTYKPSLLPDIVAAMTLCKNPDIQMAIAFDLVERADIRENYSSDLGQVLIKAAGTPGLELARRQEVLDALAMINTPAAVQAILLVLAPPQKNVSSSERDAAAIALAKLKTPSHQTLETMIKALETDRSPSVIRSVCRAFTAFGPAGTAAIPHLETFLKDLPQKKNLDGGEKEKPSLTLAVKKTLELVKSSTVMPAPGPKPPDATAACATEAPAEKVAQDLNAQVVIALEVINKPGTSAPRMAYLETVLLKALADPAVAPELRPELLQGLVRINTATSVQAVCAVLTSPDKYPDYLLRKSAAKALAENAHPSPHVLDSLIKALKVEPSAAVVATVCTTLSAFGPAAEPALQPLKDYLRGLPANGRLAKGETDKPWLETFLKESIAKIRQAVAEDVLSGAAAPSN